MKDVILWDLPSSYSYDYCQTGTVSHSPSVLALTLLVGRQEGHPACKKTERWGAGVVICLERGADLHMAQLIPLSLTVSCFSKIQIGFAFLVPAHPGSPGQMAVKRVCVCVCVCIVQSSLLKLQSLVLLCLILSELIGTVFLVVV